MTFTKTVKTNTHITIDGYSNAKTIKGALKDLAREMAKHNKKDADSFVEYLDYTIETLNDFSNPDYVVCLEECETATKIKDDEIVEYRDCNYYVSICFVA